MENLTVTVDGRLVEVPAGSTVLTAARKAGVEIPTLCYHPDLQVRAVCRVCLVEVEGQRLLQPACAYPAGNNMVVRTNTPKVREARRMAIELLLARHPQNCLACIRNQHCELQTLADQLGIREIRFEHKTRNLPTDQSSPSIVRDPDKCILCRRCVSACHDIQGVGILYPVNRGVEAIIAPPAGALLGDIACTMCGQCIHACPVGAIHEQDQTDEVWAALADPDKHVVVQTAPAVRVALGEEMGMEPGAIVTGKMVAALRRLGFDRVFDTDFTADLTIIEEGHELLARLKNGGKTPMITSCSPGWIKFIEHYYPQLLEHLSSCKSPQQMFGALAKSYYAEKAGIDPAKIYVVSIMPCTAKKYEAQRLEMGQNGLPDVDVVLTTRELGRMLRQAGINFDELDCETFDDPLGISTGAAAIFGATGGVMEAALRTVYEVVTGLELETLDFEEVRGLEGIKESTVDLSGTKVKVAVAHGLSNAAKLLDKIVDGTADYQFIEIMCCPGGCIGGGGQPIPTDTAVRQKRIDAIYREDAGMPLRKSHANPAVDCLYKEYLIEPLGEKSHHLLHTHYTNRGKW